jgi:hypothetical protein
MNNLFKNKRFNLSKRIDNRLPLQSDNLKPIEIVVHLFKPDEFEQNVSVNYNYVDDINELKNDLKFRNVSYLLKLLVDETKQKLKSQQEPKQPAHLKPRESDKKKRSIRKLDLMDYVDKNREIQVQFGHIITPNQFYLNFDQSSLNSQMKKEYQICDRNLAENELKRGIFCAYVISDQSIYKRAIVSDFKKQKSALLVSIYLIDSGKHVITHLANLYPLASCFLDIEPLCFECTFDLKYERENEDVIVNKFRNLIQSCRSFKIRVIDELSINDQETRKKFV